MGIGLSKVKRKTINAIGSTILPHNAPDFLIIGAQKAGTSSLYTYLNQHPQMRSGAIDKEQHFFNTGIYFGQSWSDYQKHFLGGRHKLYFEATPAYLYHPDTAQNIAEFMPQVPLIVILRDPIKRAYSAWNHYRTSFNNSGSKTKIIKPKPKPKRQGNYLYECFFKNRQVFPTFHECIEMEMDLIQRNQGFEPALLRRGLYLEQLETYWQYFSSDQMLILGFKDLMNEPCDTLNQVCDFVGASDYNWNKIKFEAKNQKNYSEPMSDQDHAILKDFFAEPNRKLFEKIGPINW